MVTPYRDTLSPPSLEAQHQREMVRLHELWQKDKQELADVKAELSKRGGAEHGGHNKTVASLQALTVDLRDKCRFFELQLAGAREEGNKLAESNNELRQALSEAQSQTVGLQAQLSQQSPLIDELRSQCERLGREKQSLVESLHSEQRRAEGVLATKEQTALLLEQKSQAVSEELGRALQMHQASAAAAESADARIAELERTNGELGRQLMAAKEQLKYLHLSRRSEAQVQALLHQLQLDNARLVKLLSSTDEYKEFVAYADDSGGLTYVPPPLASSGAIASGAGGASGGGRRGLVGVDEVSAAPRERMVRGAQLEQEHWVPSDAYALANDFRRQNMPHMPMEVFAELLLRLNRVWRAREAKRLERQRTKSAKKIAELRRRMAQNVPYDEVLQSSETERLRRELKQMRLTFNVGRRKLNETEERLLESSLESAAAIETQLQHSKAQNEQLLAELADHELRSTSAFGDGVAAASVAATEVSDRLAERLNELVRDFQRKTLHLNRADVDIYMRMLQLQSWFLESLDRRIVQSREKMANVRDATLASRPMRQQQRPPQGPHRDGAAADEPGCLAHNGTATAPSTAVGSVASPQFAAALGSSSYVGLVDGGDSDDFDD